MSYDSKVARSEIFVATATVGAHSNAADGAFRMREVKFLSELFSNWVDSSAGGASAIQTTQISRYLDSLCREGYARRIGRKIPLFRLTRTGLIELLSRLVSRHYYPAREHFFFLLYFIRNYRPRLSELVRAEGRQFPLALKMELEDLLDAERLLGREIEHCERESKKLAARIRDARSTSDLARARLSKGAPLREVVAEAERLYPYELNSQRPLTELIAGIPEHLRSWELETGNAQRVLEIWEPAQRMLEAYLRELRARAK